MITPAIPANEQERLAALRSYQMLDTLPEKDFDTITTLTASICDVPISFITLMDADRNYLKSQHGIDLQESPRDTSFCGHAIVDNAEVFLVKDALKDIRFKDNPVVTEQNIRFYAGVTLYNPDGYALGTLCILDNKPRELTDKQINALKALASQVVNLLEERKKNIALKKLQKELKENNEQLKNFAGIISHDMKMPLANMIVTSDILKKKYGESMDDQGIEYLDYLKQSSFTLSEYITGLLEHYESDKTSQKSFEEFDTLHLFEEIVELLNINVDCEINLPDENLEVSCNRAALEQILINLIGNSLKYNDKDKIVINIDSEKKNGMLYIKVSDNGIGIPKEKLKNIFDLFTTLGNLDRNGKKGNGIGLSTVKKLINNLGGDISVTSELGKGTTFDFSIECK
ncbi:sensor histidine kinase [Marixanthomonas ophiurae]|uniref:histidine kinase n=1 Tax=Marixanthomonas ophiurae TaxID=387659 RepID=A0A3E1Q895_9FLAO|nr:GAF domain-containing sensor histidine kinase [Marixanthomonas ophiurae]RFN58342.1 GAF domain-containing protein [Marixanthomonas ophiurae]